MNTDKDTQPAGLSDGWIPAKISASDSEWKPDYVIGFNDALELVGQEYRRLLP